MKIALGLLAALTAAVAVAQGRGPFTSQEEDLLRSVWPEIREAADYEDIDWRSVGLARAPGSPEARREMAARWDSIRETNDFDRIDWRSGSGYRDDDRRSSRSLERRGAFEDAYTGPFTAVEADEMSEVWPQIREAGSYEDINWRAVGLSGAPGDRQARRIMAENWGSLREAARFEDIDWRNVSGYRR